MKVGDIVRWTFAKTSTSINPDNIYHLGVLINPVIRPINSWIVMLSDGELVHSDETEIEVISEVWN
tara:strand:+ start:3922 stop:4119 length:198 start_codon:yes stop_codon:yes gene_type:complete